MTHQERQGLASYVLGALAPAERRQLEEHLLGCAECREELVTYAGVPGLLARLSAAEAVGGTLLPPPSSLPATLAAVESERKDRARQLSRWRGAAVATSLAAAVAGILSFTPGSSSFASELPLVAAPGVASRGVVAMQPRAWGTELQLRLEALPLTEDFEAYAVDDAGRRTHAASWGSTPDGRALVPAAVPVSWDRMARIVVQTDAGVPLLVLVV